MTCKRCRLLKKKCVFGTSQSVCERCLSNGLTEAECEQWLPPKRQRYNGSLRRACMYCRTMRRRCSLLDEDSMTSCSQCTANNIDCVQVAADQKRPSSNGAAVSSLLTLALYAPFHVVKDYLHPQDLLNGFDVPHKLSGSWYVVYFDEAFPADASAENYFLRGVVAKVDFGKGLLFAGDGQQHQLAGVDKTLGEVSCAGTGDDYYAKVLPYLQSMPHDKGHIVKARLELVGNIAKLEFVLLSLTFFDPTGSCRLQIVTGEPVPTSMHDEASVRALLHSYDWLDDDKFNLSTLNMEESLQVFGEIYQVRIAGRTKE